MPNLLKLKITNKVNDYYLIRISEKKQHADIKYSPEKNDLILLSDNKFCNYIKDKRIYLERMLHNKKKESFYVGFKLKFVFPAANPESTFYNFKENIIAFNRTQKEDKISELKHSEKIPTIYSDGSFHQKMKSGGIAYIIEIPNQPQKTYSKQIKAQGNNIAELIAIIEGLKKLRKHKKIKIVTDSRYVIKGLISWIPIWKVNRWKTVNGEKAKNRYYWRQLDRLTKRKYIELQWVKSHSNHKENTICDILSREITKQK